MKFRLNTLFSVFTPKDVKFFPMLKETATILKDSASLLQDLFHIESKESIPELCAKIKAEELKGDKITGKISKALNETFITPFDREDIDALADKLDDVIDTINRSAQKVLLYLPEKLPKCAQELSCIINKGALEIQKGVNELEKLKHADNELRHCYKEIKTLEEAADVVYEHGIIKLFQEEKNTLELIKLKEIIQELEKTANKINNTGKIFKTIFVKYA